MLACALDSMCICLQASALAEYCVALDAVCKLKGSNSQSEKIRFLVFGLGWCRSADMLKLICVNVLGSELKVR